MPDPTNFLADIPSSLPDELIQTIPYDRHYRVTPSSMHNSQVTEKFIQYYWRQVVPYVLRTDPTAGQVFRQNTGSQAAIIRRVLQARRQFDDSLADARRDPRAWESLVRDIDQIVRQMHLWKLQTVGS